MATAGAESVTDGTGSADMQSLSKNIQLVPEDVLLNLCKGPLRNFVRNCQDSQQVECVWESLFLTFSARSTSRNQTFAVSNALVLFIEHSSASRVDSTRQMLLSCDKWLAVFQTILNRFEDATPRPMKNVLAVLSKILRHHPDSSEAHLIKAGVINYTMPSIILADPRSRTKSSVATLDRLVRDNAISVKTFISLTCEWLAVNYEKWYPLYQTHCTSLHIDTSCFTTPDLKYDEAGDNSRMIVPMILNLALLIYPKRQGSIQVAGSLLAALYTKDRDTAENLSEACYPLMSWVAPTRHIMLEDIDSLEFMSRSILLSLLECGIQGFLKFIESLPLDVVLSGNMRNQTSIDEYLLLFSTLQIGKRIGYVRESSETTRSGAAEKTEPLILDSKTLGHFLLHKEQKIRMSTLSLLITDPISTAPLSAAAGNAILMGLPSIHAESTSKVRQELTSLNLKLMARLRGSSNQKHYMEKDGLDAKEFMERYVSFLEGELVSTASYQRHITSLKSLSIILNTGVDPNVNHVPKNEQALWRYKVNVLRPSLFRLLVNLLLDPFEEVRGTALNLLSLFTNEALKDSHGESDVVQNLTAALAKAEILASNTSRADHTDTVARLYHALFTRTNSGDSTKTPEEWFQTKIGVVNELLQRLEAKTFRQGGLFSTSTRDSPLHGYLAALKYIVTTPNFHAQIADNEGRAWRNVHDRIIAACTRIWEEVKPVLCIDSPEGHTDDTVDDLALGPKDMLSYSWRALRETSYLLHATMANTTYAPQDMNGLRRGDYDTIGALSFVQLSELRHRGAFSAVSQSFITCCVRCSENKDPEISSLPDGWYEESKKIIQDQASKLTRRSAGLPAIVSGISIAKSDSPLFSLIMNELQDISSQPVLENVSYNELSLPQVHAMNCLKDIFMTTKLGDKTESFIMSTLGIATESLSSSVWAIRNCGLMLFHALMIKMCKRLSGAGFGAGGSSGAESGMSISFQKYPGLTQLLTKLLNSADDSKTPGSAESDTETQKIFPALEIIVEKVPSLADNDDALLRGLVFCRVKSAIWMVRDQAARVYASLLQPTEILKSLKMEVYADTGTQSQKQIHGKLLCIRYALLRAWHSEYWNDHSGKIFEFIQEIFQRLFQQTKSQFGQAALVDILTDALEHNIKRKELTLNFANNVFETYDLEQIMSGLLSNPEERLNEIRAGSLLRRALTWAIILKNSLQSISESPVALIGPFFDLSTGDSDAACWILECVREVFPGYQQQKDFLSLYLLILLQEQEESVKAKAVLNLSEILQDALEQGLAVGFVDKWPRVSDHLYVQSQDQVWSRELTENVLQLQGSLLALKYRDRPVDSDSKELALDLRRWVVSLRSALSEETVFSSRLAAIVSLKAFCPIMRRPDQPSQTSPIFLELYVTLYDMLNDDDDELRDFAAPIASWVLSYSSSVFPDRTVDLAGIPARESLVEFLSTNFNNQRGLFHHAVKRLMNSVIVSGERAPFVPFETLLGEHRKESTVLFEEERQNLFIDDICEIDIWSAVLKGMNRAVFDQETVGNLLVWASKGLECLDTLFTSSGEQDGAIGWTSKPEVFSLGVLLFSVTSLLIDTGEEDKDSGVNLSKALENLYVKGQSLALHPHWLSRIKSAIPVSKSS